MKIKGSEFMEWYDNHFPKGYFWDSDEEMLHDDNGEWKLVPGTTYDTDELGDIYENHGPFVGEDGKVEIPGLNVASAIRAWRKSRDFDLFTIQVPKARTENVVALLESVGVKVKP